MGIQLFPHNLFGNYVVEISKLFKYTFKGFKTTSTASVSPLNVYYGTPAAAFRYFYNKFNGVMVLPVMNFIGVDYRRRYDKEVPSQDLRIYDKRSYNPANGTIAYMRPPMQFDVTYQFSLYNNNLRERDRMVHQIMQMFPRGGCSLRWYPDKIDYPDVFLFMPLRLEENFTDETEYDGLEQKETRDQIKTNFNIISSAVVPYDMIHIPIIHKLIIDEFIEEDYNRFDTVSIQERIELFGYEWRHFAPAIAGLIFKESASVSINNFSYHIHESYGKTTFGGIATTA